MSTDIGTTTVRSQSVRFEGAPVGDGNPSQGRNAVGMESGTPEEPAIVGRVRPEIHEIPAKALRLGMSPRLDGIDRQHVATLAQVPEQLPPILVHRGTMTVVDGAHRLEVARLMGADRVRVVFFEGAEPDAYLEAVRANVAHGKPLSLKEREQAARWVLQQHPDWSDRRIAGVTGLAPGTVARCRASTAQNEQLTTRVGRDGRARPINPSTVRERIAERFRQRPTASVKEVAAELSSSEATVRDVRRRVMAGFAEPPAGRNRPIAGAVARTDPTSLWDPALSSSEGSASFIDWLDAHRIDDDDWASLLDALPANRLYVLADEARRQSASWSRLCAELESRARRHR